MSQELPCSIRMRFTLALSNLEGYFQSIIMRVLDHFEVGFGKKHYWSQALICPMSLVPDLVHILQVFHLLSLPPNFVLIDPRVNYINYPRSSCLRLLCWGRRSCWRPRQFCLFFPCSGLIDEVPSDCLASLDLLSVLLVFYRPESYVCLQRIPLTVQSPQFNIPRE